MVFHIINTRLSGEENKKYVPPIERALIESGHGYEVYTGKEYKRKREEDGFQDPEGIILTGVYLDESGLTEKSGKMI